MKRITFEGGAYGFTSISVDGEKFVVPPKVERSPQAYLFTRFLRAVESGNARAARAVRYLEEGRKLDAARELIDNDAVVGEYAEWTLPTLLGAEGEVNIRQTLEILIDRTLRDMRDAIRNYPWKAEGLFEFQRMCSEALQNVTGPMDGEHAEALRIDAARSNGLRLEGHVTGGDVVYNVYRKMISQVLPEYRDTEFFFDDSDSADVPAFLSHVEGRVMVTVDTDKWERAVATAAKNREKAEEKRKGVRRA